MRARRARGSGFRHPLPATYSANPFALYTAFASGPAR